MVFRLRGVRQAVALQNAHFSHYRFGRAGPARSRQLSGAVSSFESERLSTLGRLGIVLLRFAVAKIFRILVPFSNENLKRRLP